MRRYVLSVVVLILVVFFIISFSLWSPIVSIFYPVPLKHLVKVSGRDFDNGSVAVYFITWYGCPYGATVSWPLYVFLEKFGNVTVEPHYSIVEGDIGSPVPGLLFLNYSSKLISFHVLYLYNQYLNATPNGTRIDNLVTYGLGVIKQEEPPWVYSLIKEYEVDLPLVSPWTNVVNSGNPPHVATALIITSPKGTFMLIGYPSTLSPQDVLSISSNATYLLALVNSGKVPPQILSFSEQLVQDV
ncbi:MAG: DUF929 domain-containing protein [Candidatus Aramenus sp.]|nr:DUF929 domain-containing protein [Candidatus Aramenus sp.]